VPLPILLRKLIRHLSAPELRVLVYLHLRSSKYGICYPTQEEIAFELGLQGTKNLGPYIKSLEARHLISTKTSMGRKFYLIHDPRIGLQHLAKTGKLTAEELEEVNNLCADLGQQPIEPAV
jgi:DNA-binding MarR family transcriptional regulator